MKIKHFSAEGVHGYLSYDIDFNDDLTFLIGLNGSGKTTVLKLISGLLTPKYLNLIRIKFSKIELTLNDKNKNYVVAASQNKSKLVIDFNNQTHEFQIPSTQKIDDFLNGLRFDKSEITDYITKFEVSPYAQEINKHIKPIILGLNRRGTDTNEIDNNEMFEYAFMRKYLTQATRDGVDNALEAIKKKMHDKVRENANKKGKLLNDFREKIIKELIKPKDDVSIIESSRKKMDFKKYLDEIEHKRNSFNTIANYLKMSSLEDSYDKIVNMAKKVIDELAKTNVGNTNEEAGNFYRLFYKWMTLSYQLDNVYEITHIGESFFQKMEKLDLSFNRLKSSLNLFFAETNKEVDINGLGDLLIKLKNKNGNIFKTNSIFELSSGEKQLIILFSQLAFAQDSKNDVFIVDEPELSLHLAWQEQFVDALQKACPEMQFILATHAPAIVNEKNRLNLCVNLSKQ